MRWRLPLDAGGEARKIREVPVMLEAPQKPERLTILLRRQLRPVQSSSFRGEKSLAKPVQATSSDASPVIFSMAFLYGRLNDVNAPRCFPALFTRIVLRWSQCRSSTGGAFGSAVRLARRIASLEFPYFRKSRVQNEARLPLPGSNSRDVWTVRDIMGNSFAPFRRPFLLAK